MEGEGGVPSIPPNPPPIFLENSNLLNSPCKFKKERKKAFDTLPLTPLANKIIAQTLLEKKILDRAIMQLIICIYVKQKSNFILFFGPNLELKISQLL